MKLVLDWSDDHIDRSRYSLERAERLASVLTHAARPCTLTFDYELTRSLNNHQETA